MLDDEMFGALVVPRLVTLRRKAPRAYRVAPPGGLAFTAAMRMVDRIHRDPAHSRPDPEPPAASGFPDRLILMVEVTHLTDGRIAFQMNHSRLARRKFDLSVAGLLGEKLRRHSRGASQLSALSRPKLYVMNHRAQRDVAQRKGVAHEDIGAVARDYCSAYRQPVRTQNVAF